MSEEKKEKKIDLKDRMLSDDALGQVSGGSETVIYCSCGKVAASGYNLCDDCLQDSIFKHPTRKC